MKENDSNKAPVKLTEMDRDDITEKDENPKAGFSRLKKPVIFGLMAFVFIGCMYLIFMPSKDGTEKENVGLNEVVPQAADAVMQEDKGKAYESELMEQKERESKQSLSTLSDYWNVDSAVSQQAGTNPAKAAVPVTSDHHNQALTSYRNIQGTLGNFYDNRGESDRLQNEIRSLKSQIAQKENVSTSNPVESQLALMEKSYQMAAKYFPTGGSNVKSESKVSIDTGGTKTQINRQKYSEKLYPTASNIVSALYREPSDSAWIAELSRQKNRNFYGLAKETAFVQSPNSIRACIHGEQLVTENAAVKIRILEDCKIGKQTVAKGAVLTAMAKFQGARLILQVNFFESNASITPVEISVYDLDGQPGLVVPLSPERSAVTETIANMGNTSGTSVSLSSSAGQQITSDLSKSLVQGISGYFSKKIRMPKVTLKAGYQVFLVAKK